jgi:hypothetical protein
LFSIHPITRKYRAFLLLKTGPSYIYLRVLTFGLVPGAVQGIEDSGSLAVCLEHLQKLADLPGLLKVFEAIRRPRAEFMMKVARERAVGLLLPDGKEQEQRDNSFKEHEIDLTDKNWDGKCSDDPPEGGLLSPLYAGYMFGFDVMDHVS